jgi:hypothetical protein
MAKVTKPETINFKLTGLAPMIMHSGRLANPLDPATKALKVVTGKRKKTDEDHAEMARLEWIGGLYQDEDGNLGIPSENIEAMLIEASGAQRLKKQFKAGVFCEGFFPIDHDGPKDLKKLYETGNYSLTVQVRVMTARVMRTRPIFKKWSMNCAVSYFPQVVSRENVIDAMEQASMFIGIGDWRPRYGRFSVEVLK